MTVQPASKTQYVPTDNTPHVRERNPQKRCPANKAEHCSIRATKCGIPQIKRNTKQSPIISTELQSPCIHLTNASEITRMQLEVAI